MSSISDELELSEDQVKHIEMEAWKRFGLNIDVFSNGDWKVHLNVDGSAILPNKEQAKYIDKLVQKEFYGSPQ